MPDKISEAVKKAPPLLVERFWLKVDKTGDCWLWTAHRHRQGYGLMGVGGKVLKAHRLSYWLANGSLPDGLKVCHRCDNPSCVNPDHLFLGSQADNVRDMIAKGRHVAPSGERAGGAKLSREQVAEIRSKYKPGQVRQIDLAREYGMSQTQISEIIRGESWRTP